MTEFISAPYFLLQLMQANKEPLTLAGLRTKSLVFSASPRPQLGFPARRWQGLQAASGPLSVRALGVGLFSDAAGTHLLQGLFADGAHANLCLFVPQLGQFTGPFMVTELAYEGQEAELVNWRMAVQSAGDIDFEMA